MVCKSHSCRKFDSKAVKAAQAAVAGPLAQTRYWFDMDIPAESLMPPYQANLWSS